MSYTRAIKPPPIGPLAIEKLGARERRNFNERPIMMRIDLLPPAIDRSMSTSWATIVRLRRNPSSPSARTAGRSSWNNRLAFS
jgi:hypothetical protein